MLYLSEDESAALVSHDLAFEAVRLALAAAADRTGMYPTTIGHTARGTDRISIKLAADRHVTGVKIGSYWPDNTTLGLPRHNSFILLIDPQTGQASAGIEAGQVNGYRTAAADAVAASVLARPDSSTLTLFGSGNQAYYECVALCRVLPIRTVNLVARNPATAATLTARLATHGITATPASAGEACESADIVVTATTATEPLFDADRIRPGTHIAAMGADGQGKRELPDALLHKASLFCDWPDQSTTIGEFQYLTGDDAPPITMIGAVLRGTAPGRTSSEEITVFDSSGIALQDLYVGQALVAEHSRRALG